MPGIDGTDGEFDGLMMDVALTLPALFRRAETLFGESQIVTRRQDETLHRYRYRDARPGAYDLSSVQRIIVGRAPQAMIEAFEQRHALKIVHAWGMTEINPTGTVCHLPDHLRSTPLASEYRQRSKQGRPIPFVEIRARNGAGLIPWDGRTIGELEVRGPFVAAGYFRLPGFDDRFTDDRWFRTTSSRSTRAARLTCTSAGKFQKSVLRERFRRYRCDDGNV
jgi:acyl-CoA synthetase (AMP-forming)/AMP-acid ligase II